MNSLEEFFKNRILFDMEKYFVNNAITVVADDW